MSISPVPSYFLPLKSNSPQATYNNKLRGAAVNINVWCKFILKRIQLQLAQQNCRYTKFIYFYGMERLWL